LDRTPDCASGDESSNLSRATPEEVSLIKVTFTGRKLKKALSSTWLGHRPFTAEKGVQIPQGSNTSFSSGGSRHEHFSS
jgi:hypothetical protein